MATLNPCSCDSTPNCPDPVPLTWQLIVPAIGNSSCCLDVGNQTFILYQDPLLGPCAWNTADSSPCTNTGYRWRLNPDSLPIVVWNLECPGEKYGLNPVAGVYHLAPAAFDCMGSNTLNLVPYPTSFGCSWPNTLKVNPVNPNISDWGTYAGCLLIPGCAEGTILKCLTPPGLGASSQCCGDGGGPSGTGGGGCAGDCGCAGGGADGPGPAPGDPGAGGCDSVSAATVYTLGPGMCSCRPKTDCPAGTTPQFSPNPLSQVTAMLARWQRLVQPPVPGALSGPGRIVVNYGNLFLQVGAPGAGPFGPTPVFTYNSLSASASSEFGSGWSCSHKPRLTSVSSQTVTIIDGAGTPLRFTNKTTASAYYQPSTRTSDSVMKNSDGSWTQTQPDGFQTDYDTTGKAVRVSNAAGSRWTTAYDSGGRVSSVTDPLLRRTSYAYTSGGNIRRILDPGGRITSFTVDGNGNLIQVITPDGARVTLQYSGATGRQTLTSYTDQRGQETSYSYDSNSAVNSVTTPTGDRTSYSYRDWGTTQVIDAAGQVTTLLHNFARNIQGVINPTGARTTYLWSQGRLRGFIDGNGNRTTFGYASLANQNVAIQSIQDAMEGRYTFLYNANNQVQGLIH
jgi:YD repeat-containing protein